MKKAYLSILLIVLTILPGCEVKKKKDVKEKLSDVPEWSRNVVWYQIFPERFRNGDPNNDPTIDDIRMTYPEDIPETWKVSKWNGDWYEEDAYMEDLTDMDFSSKVQLRRYGGDLQGVLDKIDYLADLGITGVYFNPLNDAPSLHKYDPRHWRHIDRNFGPDPKGDVEIMNSEIPDDPSTWQWTSADKLFLEVIQKLHEKGIKVIVDYSWNHTGYDFWAVNDIRKNGSSSSFKDWFEVKQFNDTTTEQDETEIEGWWGHKYLPLVKEEEVEPESKPPHEGNIVSEMLKQHIFNVTKRWLDPNGDGNVEDGVDGIRLDVASEMTMGFWRDYRKFVKSINPEALLIAEAWWFDWPDLSGPEKMVQGDAFDGLMNYRWYALARGFFTQTEPALKPSEFVSWYDSLVADITIENQQAMMNIVATHDAPRLSTSFFNEGRFDQGSKLNENPNYKTHKPDQQTWDLVRMFLLHQFSFVGSPHIWNGDELGMWGANDPDCRKPLWWDDIVFEVERLHPYKEREVPEDIIKPDFELRDYYKKLIAARVKHSVLALGNLNYELIDDKRMLLVYSRTLDNENAIAAFNRSKEPQEVAINANSGEYIDVISQERFKTTNGQLKIDLNPIAGRLLIGINPNQ